MASNQKQNLITQTAVSAASTTSASFNIPARSRKFAGILTAANVNAATTVSCKIQHSPDKVNWYDYITFTDIVGAAGVGLGSPASYDPPVLPYLQAVITLSGATKLSDVTVDIWFQNI